MQQESLAEQYRALAPALNRCKREGEVILSGLLGEIQSAHFIRAQLRESRAKTLDSIRRKARKNDWREDEAITRTTDLVGFRIVCSNREDIGRTKDLILSSSRFQPQEDQPVQDFVRQPQDSGYRALHLNVTYQVTGPHLTSVACEIQIRTLAQEMWATLTHYDIYKHQEAVPEHIQTSSRRLSSLLSTADEIGQDIREQVSVPLVGVQEERNELKPETLAFIYRRVFGQDPPDYLVRYVLNVCDEVGCFRLDAIDRVVRDTTIRSAVAVAYEHATGWDLPDETWFELCPVAAVKGADEAASEAERRGRDELEEVEAIARRDLSGDALAELPETLVELIESSGFDRDGLPSGVISYDLADALGALRECAICGAPIIDVDIFIENVLEHYDADEDPEGQIANTLINSGIEVGNVDNPRLCSYHGWVMSKDD